MLNVLKRLSLGLVLITLTSAVLLMSDVSRRTEGPRRVLKIAVLQHASSPVLDDGIRGLIDGLGARGYRDGERIAIQRFNAQGDMATDVAIARQVTAGEYDLVVTSSTPSMQAVANNNRDGKTRHVFFLVADPFASGIGLDRADPLKHAPHMIGHGSLAPVDRSIQLARDSLPSLRRVGVAWNPAESNSAVFTGKLRDVTTQVGLELLEANVDGTAAVTDAINSLVSRGAQMIWVGGDNTMMSSIDTVVAVARRSGVPVVTVLPGRPDRGTLIDCGPDFVELGHLAAGLVADVLEGADMTKIPIRDVMDLVPPFVAVNVSASKGLNDAWAIPDAIRRDATIVVDETGVHRKAVAAQPAPAADRRPLAKRWRVSLIELNAVLDIEEAEKGVLDGLREAGLVEGRDFEKTIRNAQGDMATVSSLVDAAASDGSNMLITFSTPTLQAAIQRAKHVPVVFNYVASAVAAGAGTSDTDHLPNVTGVYLVGAYDRMLEIVREWMPRARTLGTVFVPAEVNMVVQRDLLVKAAQKAGIEIKAVAANSPNEVADAALALASSGVDAICQIPGNLTASAFPSIAQAARQARVPIFAFQSGQVRGGAVLGLARDYYESGKAAAAIAARIMRGESPATIPFVAFTKTRLMVNVEAARQLGLTPPPALVSRADEVIGR